VPDRRVDLTENPLGNGAADPIEDYLAALRLLEGVAGDCSVSAGQPSPTGRPSRVST